jgi:hypothetical protein
MNTSAAKSTQVARYCFGIFIMDEIANTGFSPAKLSDIAIANSAIGK